MAEFEVDVTVRCFRYTYVVKLWSVWINHTTRKDTLLSSFSIVNCIDGCFESTWSIIAWKCSWWGQRRNISSTYLSHIDGFCDVELNAISLNYSMYTLVNTGDNGDPIARPSSCWYMSDSIGKLVVFTQKVNIFIRLSIWIQVHSPAMDLLLTYPCHC